MPVASDPKGAMSHGNHRHSMVSRGTTQQSSAPYNRRIVLDVIRRQGSISRKEIVDQVSLSPQTVANITNGLRTSALIVARRVTGAPAGGSLSGSSVAKSRGRGQLP